MSAATATLYGAVIAGTFALLGVVIEQLLRSSGRVRCEASFLAPLQLTDVEDEQGYPRDVALEEADENTEATGVWYECAVELFNGLEVLTGLREARIVLVLDGGRRLVSHPEDVSTGKPGESFHLPGSGMQPGPTTYDTLGVVNPPPRQFVRKELRGGFRKEAADALKTGRWERIAFKAQRPKRPFFGILGSKTYRATILESKKV